MHQILFGGDLMIGRLFNDKLENMLDKDYKKIFGNIYPKLIKSDLVAVNLETTICDISEEEKYPNKVFNYKLQSKYSNILKVANIGYVSLANNHICDYKKQGLIETINNLEKLGISHVGAGIDSNEAKKYIIKEIKNKSSDTIKIAFFSMCDHMEEWEADKNKHGIFYIPINSTKMNSKQKEAIQLVKDLKSKNIVDFIVFSCHWNSNYVEKIDLSFKKFGRALIDAGVDIIHGHSPHHILPIEKYNGGVIMYSLGGFVDDYALDKDFRNDIGICVKFMLEKGKNVSDNMKIIYHKIQNLEMNQIKKKELLGDTKLTNVKGVRHSIEKLYRIKK